MNKAGFSLLETLVAFLIIAVLVALALPYYFNAVESARMTEAVQLWGRNKSWVSGQDLSPEQAQRFTSRLNKQVKLKYFTGEIICIAKENANELCWEAQFTQQDEKAHARYKLVTAHNFLNLACVPLNGAGERFCKGQALDENNPETIGDEKGYIIH